MICLRKALDLVLKTKSKASSLTLASRRLGTSLTLSLREKHTAIDNVQVASLIREFDGVAELNDHQSLYNFSVNDPDTFWGTLARSRLQWLAPFDQVQSKNATIGDVSWFRNGQLNVSGELI